MEKNKEYYNEGYKDNPIYNCHYTESKYFSLWSEVLKNLNKQEKIADLGCGTGQLAEMLYDNGFNYSFGVDFSEEAIEMCKRLPLVFYCSNLLEDFNFMEYDTVLIFETLEHIEKDLDILSRIPKGKRVIGSVPNFDDPSHVRTFQTKEDVFNRYSRHIKIDKIYHQQVHKRGNIIFTFYGHKA